MDDIRRVMTMVAELHKLGYEQLRLAPAMAPSGMYWRGHISSVQNFTKKHGAILQIYSKDITAMYSTADGPQIYGWADAETDSLEQLARKFVERFPSIAAAGHGSDLAYVTWYADMLTATAPDGFIYAFADWDTPTDRMPTMKVSPDVVIPLPPPGKADD